MIDYNWFDHIVAAIFLLIIPIAALRSGTIESNNIELPPKKHLYYTNGLVLIIGASIILTMWNIANRDWSSLGFEWIASHKFLPFTVIAICLFYGLDLWSSFRENKNSDHSSENSLAEIIPTDWDDFRHYIFLAFAAGICEEIMFRGFLIPYVNQLCNHFQYHHWISIIFPALAFGMSHYYQGWISVAKILAVAILLGIIFSYSGSLILVVIIHVSIDLVSGYMGLIFHRKNHTRHDNHENG